MKRVSCLFFLFVSMYSAVAQNGKIIDKKPIELPDSIFAGAKNKALATQILTTVNFFRISYLSDGLKVTGYIAEPKAPGKYPCIISNRGGNRDFGQWSPKVMAAYLGRMATWGYVVIASQYRGNDGGEGKEEFGGSDVNDVLNLLYSLNEIEKADTARIGIEGTSRGGMMTYLAMKQTNRFKAAVVTSGLANAFTNISNRPEMEKGVYSQLIPNYSTNKEEELKKRSAVYWADKLCKTTPLLIIHGSADKRVPAAEAIELVQKLYVCQHPTRFILLEGADHGISEFMDRKFEEPKKHFDYYLRDGKPLPDMKPHGF